MVFLRKIFALALAVFTGFVLPACSRQKVLAREDLRSDLSAAISYCGEVEMTMDRLQEERLTESFTRTHAAQLATEIKEAEKQLENSRPEAGTESQFQEYRHDLEQIAKPLKQISALAHSPSALIAAQREIAEIRQRLEQAGSSL